MREILFRGRLTDKSRWVYGCLLNNIYGAVPAIMTDQSVDDAFNLEFEYDHVEEKTVGQFTGLTDKNGKKIFEGDVFKFPDEIFESYYTSCGTEYNSWETENYGVIGFDENSGRYDFVQYRFENNAVEADLHENKDIDFDDFVRELEVIGNIHDNPELLEKK